MDEILEIAKYTIPSIITGAVAAYFLKQFVHIENSKRKFEALKVKKKESLPKKLEAYERMILFLDRIHLVNLVFRITPDDSNKIDYAKFLLAQINAEFEHNLVQQIYLSQECWTLIENTKNTILNNITAYSMQDDITTGEELQKLLIDIGNDGESPTKIAQQFIQQEVQSIL